MRTIINCIRSVLLHFIALTLMAASSCFAQSAPPGDALFGDLGGKEGIEKIVGDFLPIVFHDARIRKVFADADIGHLAKMLAEQFCAESGGPCKYTGKSMKAAHVDMHISNAQFNALVEDLQLAMDKNGIPSRTQNKLLAKLAPMQRDVVTKK